MLDAREYKLLLDPASLDPASLDDADDFLESRLKPLAAAFGIGVPHGFKKKKPRAIRFYDTATGVLTGADFVLRRRVEDGEDPEVTLKLRMPDLFVVAGTRLPGAAGEDTKFEEDIAPLEVVGRDGALTVARPPSIRSRFARSTSEASGGALDTLGDAFALFPTLAGHLAVGADAPLLTGPAVHEMVFKGAELDLADGFEGELALTLWRFEPADPVERIAEISYSVALKEGHMSGDAARQALALFRRMQQALDPDLRYPSKTRLALPAAGRGGPATPD